MHQPKHEIKPRMGRLYNVIVFPSLLIFSTNEEQRALLVSRDRIPLSVDSLSFKSGTEHHAELILVNLYNALVARRSVAMEAAINGVIKTLCQRLAPRIDRNTCKNGGKYTHIAPPPPAPKDSQIQIGPLPTILDARKHPSAEQVVVKTVNDFFIDT
ncbi:uncharacterized protein N7459_007910 [Penicillium hispanicum]|uniref:uncharacterized protein n=1 Tax=Penicillium hispanicum TaxID=1080232 RepID=UPI00253FD979|nr:uncharacterized protein N7459_007910 [Penicillium hispanicum]KAJ5573483.1 hypothetical protein N7459_007910 [Penicillium hispanicum]